MLPDALGPLLRGEPSTRDGQPCYRLEGELDMSGAALLLDRAGTIADGTPGDLVLDLGEVTFIDSSGIRALIQIHRRLAAEGRSLRLIHLTPTVHRLIALVGLDDAMGIRADGAPPD